MVGFVGCGGWNRDGRVGGCREDDLADCVAVPSLNEMTRRDVVLDSVRVAQWTVGLVEDKIAVLSEG